MTRTSSFVPLLTIAGAVAAISVLAGCSSSSTTAAKSTPAAAVSAAPSTAAPSTAAPSTASAAAADSAGAGTAKACAALPTFDAAMLNYPGADSDASPSAADLTAWAATATPPLQVLVANLPAELQPDIATVQSAITKVAGGTAVDPSDTTLNAALRAIDESAHGHCGFPTLDVTGTGTALANVPATLAAGPVSISFTNQAPAGKAGFVLLVARVHDGAKYTLDQIRNNSVDLTTIADVVAEAQPGADGSTGYATATLTPGHYVVAAPIGTPPNFAGTLIAEFDVH
jgi:hypothetical protein